MPTSNRSDRELLRRPARSLPSGTLGYAEGHGARRRAEKRIFAREEAGALSSSRMIELERAQTGETRRLGMREAGLGERLGREQEFARPGQRAESRRLGALGGLKEAEAERVRYGTEFEKGSRGTLEDILKSQEILKGAEAEEAELGVSEIRRKLGRRDEAEAEAARSADIKPVSEVTARPESGRELNPKLKRLLLKAKVTPFGSLESYSDVLKMLGKGTVGLYDTAFPKKRPEASGTW